MQHIDIWWREFCCNLDSILWKWCMHEKKRLMIFGWFKFKRGKNRQIWTFFFQYTNDYYTIDEALYWQCKSKEMPSFIIWFKLDLILCLSKEFFKKCRFLIEMVFGLDLDHPNFSTNRKSRMFSTLRESSKTLCRIRLQEGCIKREKSISLWP